MTSMFQLKLPNCQRTWKKSLAKKADLVCRWTRKRMKKTWNFFTTVMVSNTKTQFTSCDLPNELNIVDEIFVFNCSWRRYLKMCLISYGLIYKGWTKKIHSLNLDKFVIHAILTFFLLQKESTTSVIFSAIFKTATKPEYVMKIVFFLG